MVGPGDRVLDLGTGLGTYAFFAARAGAAEVVAVDGAPVLHLAQLIARSQGLEDRITFVRGSVPEIEIPGTFEVIIFEDFPVPFLDVATWRLLRELVKRSLRPGGRMVPEAARLSVALVQSQELWSTLLPLTQEWNRYGVDWTVLQEYVANEPTRTNLQPEDLLSPPLRSAPLPMIPVPTPADMEVSGSWVAASPGTIHALAFWFDLDLGAGGWISNEPRSGGGRNHGGSSPFLWLRHCGSRPGTE